LELKRQLLELSRLFNTFYDDLRDKFTNNRIVTQILTKFRFPPTVLAEADKQENKVALAYLHKQQERQQRESKARSRARLPVTSRSQVTFALSPVKAAATAVPVTPTTKLSELQDDEMTDAPCTKENYAKLQTKYQTVIDKYNTLHHSKTALRDENNDLLNKLKDSEKRTKKLRAEREIWLAGKKGLAAGDQDISMGGAKINIGRTN
jgi:hypothetical protein